MELAAIVCLGAVGVLLGAEARGLRSLAAVAKCAASAAFVAAAWLAGALATAHGPWLLAGLGLCAVGDALLLSEGQGAGFRLGIGAFLLGHVSYGVAFTRLPLSVTGGLLGAVGAAVGASFVLRWLAPHVPADLRVPVRAYVIVISAMVALASAAFAAGARPSLLAGAVAFAVSDVSVARDRFVARGFVNAAWGLPLYYGAQLLLASAAGPG